MFKKIFIAATLIASISSFAKTESVTIDPANSKVVYLGKKVTGEHFGEVKISQGTLKFDGKMLTGGEFTIDMTTITNTDISDKDYNKKFVDHMNSDDFFATTAHKTAKMVITKATHTKGDNYSIIGNLTIKGKTAPVTFDATATTTSAKAVITFDRTTYDVKYGSGKFFQGLGDKMINDDVQLTVTLTAKK